MSVDPGMSRTFLCGFRVSMCCNATVHRKCSLHGPDQYECQHCHRNTEPVRE